VDSLARSLAAGPERFDGSTSTNAVVRKRRRQTSMQAVEEVYRISRVEKGKVRTRMIDVLGCFWCGEAYWSCLDTTGEEERQA